MAATQAPGRAASRWPDVGREMTAATAMAALVAGVPWALARFVGWPLPAAMPSWSEITTALADSYILDSFFTKALALVCWIVWVELVASLLWRRWPWCGAAGRGRYRWPVRSSAWPPGWWRPSRCWWCWSSPASTTTSRR